MTVGGLADTVFCFSRPCACHLYTAPRNNMALVRTGPTAACEGNECWRQRQYCSHANEIPSYQFALS
jgi:hypothetical protein